MKSCTIACIARIIDEIAPPALAETWDNPGLQIGDFNWPVKKIMTALDPIPRVIENACKEKIDLLVTHHPLLLKPLKKLDLGSFYGKTVEACIKNKMAIYCAHTNLDSAEGGLNDLLAKKIGLIDIKVLGRQPDVDLYKLVVFAPVENEAEIVEAIGKSNAGKIGAYTCCTFRNNGIGTYIPHETSTPHEGVAGELSNVKEVRIETVVEKKDIDAVLTLIRSVHPYETMAYDLYPLLSKNSGQGMGRIGRLPKPVPFTAFYKKVKKRLKLDTVKIAGRPELMVTKVALCSGSGSGMIKAFMASGADIYVSGDLKYHDAVDVTRKGLGLLDIGHFCSEHIIVSEIARTLKKKIGDKGLGVSVQACTLETDPFSTV